MTKRQGVFGLPQGNFTIKAGTDADGDSVLCESGDFCATSTIVIGDRSLISITLGPQ